MSDNKHTVSTDALATIGTLLDASAGRDAIHLAVEPVIAANALEPGERIGFLPAPAAVGSLIAVRPFDRQSVWDRSPCPSFSRTHCSAKTFGNPHNKHDD